jgi:hypothetical protein
LTATSPAPASKGPGCLQSPGKTAVSIGWKQALGGGALKASSELLAAQLTNNTNVAQRGKIVVSAVGLDGRVAERTLGAFNLAPGATSDVSLPISGLPIQSEGSLSFAILQAEMAGPVGPVRPASTSLVYYIFDNDYAQAQLYTSSEVATLPNGGLRAADPMDVRGRVVDDQGATKEVDASAAMPAGAPRQGLARINVAPSSLITYPNGVPQLAAKAISTPEPLTSVTCYVGLSWLVYYYDQNYGEDVWNNASWFYAPASYSAVLITSTDFQTTYWWNYVNTWGMAGGVTGSISLPANTTLYATIFTFSEGPNGTHFNNWLNIGGTDYTISAVLPFSTGSGGLIDLHVPYNSEVVETTAVSDLILHQDGETGSRGLVAGSIFNLYSNTGCPDHDQTWSCEQDSDPCQQGECMYYGTQSGGFLTEGAYWKFIVAHEISHGVMEFGMGWVGNGCGSNCAVI